MKGSQSKKIKAVMQGNYASMVAETTNKRLRGAAMAGVGGILVGALLKQNAFMTGIAGAILGFVLIKGE